MKYSMLKITMLAALCFTTLQANALGLVALPDTGFSSSAYTNCYNDGRVVPPSTADDVKGNFGSYPIATANQPSTTKNNTCFVAKPGNEILSPIAGYSLVGNRINNIPDVTGGTTVFIGQVIDRVWRNSAGNMCIFGTRVRMYDEDHDSTASGKQYFEINDIARGGFADSGTVNVGYTVFATSNKPRPIYRVGRTFTSVQHRPSTYGSAYNGTNYLDLPTKNSVVVAISGETSLPPPFATTLATQDAVVNSNWVDFTTKVNYLDWDGSIAYPYSNFIYIHAACDLSNPSSWVKTGAIRLRQTGQEITKLKEIAIDGYAPPEAELP